MAEISLLKESEQKPSFGDLFFAPTPCLKASLLERELRVQNLYLKLECNNPTGSQKDRIARLQVNDAARQGYSVLYFATCGNYGVSIAAAAAAMGLQCVAFIPARYRNPRIKELLHYGVSIVRTPGTYEDAIEISSREADERNAYNANPGAGNNSRIQTLGYAAISFEIYHQLGGAPDIVAVPVSNGTTLVGIYLGWHLLYRNGKIARMPKMVAGSIEGMNPILTSALAGNGKYQAIDRANIRETEINEPLVNWNSIEGKEAIDAISSTNGWAFGAADSRLQFWKDKVLSTELIDVLPASTVGLAALFDADAGVSLPTGNYVVVLTGRKHTQNRIGEL
ncbi:MAG: pyridoxal-phosphate dependent enzyme [Acidobacteriota bacterium]